MCILHVIIIDCVSSIVAESVDAIRDVQLISDIMYGRDRIIDALISHTLTRYISFCLGLYAINIVYIAKLYKITKFMNNLYRSGTNLLLRECRDRNY